LKNQVTVVGGGLAGSEAAWQLAERGFQVRLYEMRPRRQTGAHVTDRLGELVCSNSLGSKLADRASGVLQAELLLLRSLLLDCANRTALPAGSALAVDRELFAEAVTSAVENHPGIEVIREEVPAIPDGPTILATGPLTSETLVRDIVRLTGQEYLYFFDAIAPIVTLDSVNMDIAFRASRYDRNASQDEGDYINCPMTHEEYERFVDALLAAEKIELRDFERDDPRFFEGCLPIEQIAERGRESLAFGPMRPVGLRDPRTGKRPYAVVQLRQDNLIGTLYNLVGFQTNLRWGQQEQVMRLIPGLEQAEFVRMGQMHRNTFINAPVLLNPTMQFRRRADLFFAGQITGVEGYVGNVATGLVAAVNLARLLNGQPEWNLPQTTMLGALCHYVTHAEPGQFQPMKANFGIMPPLANPMKDKRQRYADYAERALAAMRESITSLADPYLQPSVELS
jgi:methylenetetrahydrofolate--tRNA-(uracil-5-)-methyltransferase